MKEKATQGNRNKKKATLKVESTFKAIWFSPGVEQYQRQSMFLRRNLLDRMMGHRSHACDKTI
jgi:hypothetical protein